MIFIKNFVHFLALSSYSTKILEQYSFVYACHIFCTTEPYFYCIFTVNIDLKTNQNPCSFVSTHEFEEGEIKMMHFIDSRTFKKLLYILRYKNRDISKNKNVTFSEESHVPK